MNGGSVATCKNGSVLVVMQYAHLQGWTPLMYNPDLQTFTRQSSTAPMNADRGMSFALVPLSNGSFLAAGGYDSSANLRSAEIYMPAPANKWVRIDQPLRWI